MHIISDKQNTSHKQNLLYNWHYKDNLHTSITILAFRIVIISMNQNKFTNQEIINIMLRNRILGINMTL